MSEKVPSTNIECTELNKASNVEMEQIKADVCIIGAGSGGLSVAAGAVQMGASVVLLEGGEMGGDCLNWGCVPSKALLAAAKQAHTIRNSSVFGVNGLGEDSKIDFVDYGKVKDHVARVVAQIAPVDSQERFEGLGCRVIRDYGRFIDPNTVQAGSVAQIKARRFVIATGSSPLVPPIPGLDQVMFHTNETIFELREKPEHLVVIGGGPIGMELAQAHVRLGCKVTVLEGFKALGKDDPDCAAIVLEKLRDEGVTIMEGTLAERISASGADGTGDERGEEKQDEDQVETVKEKSRRLITVHTNNGDITGTHLLLAVGRKVNITNLGLDEGGIAFDKRKGISVNESLKSVSNRRVYAIGDVSGGFQFTHVAGYHGSVIIKSMLFGLPSKASTKHIPWSTYTDPELAQVGLTEAMAKEQYGSKVDVVKYNVEHNDRLIAERKANGLIKVMVVKGKPVGVSIAAPQAGELIGAWAMAIANDLNMQSITKTILPYPTVGEINKRAAGAYFGPKLFESETVKRVVSFVQKWIP